jgi:hypothetical protein
MNHEGHEGARRKDSGSNKVEMVFSVSLTVLRVLSGKKLLTAEFAEHPAEDAEKS